MSDGNGEIRLESLEEIDNIERINADIEAGLREALNDGEKDIRWRVYVSRVSGGANVKGQREPQLFNCDPSELTETSLFDRCKVYGNGIYRVRVYKNRAINNQYDLAIELPPTPVPGATPLGDVARLESRFESYMRQQNEIMMRLLDNRQSAPASAVDPMAMMTTAFGMFTNMMTSANSIKADSSLDSIAKVLDLVTKIKGDNNDAPTEREPGLMDAAIAFLKGPMAEKLTDLIPKVPPQTPNQPQQNPRQMRQPQRRPIPPTREPLRDPPRAPETPVDRSPVVEQRPPQPANNEPETVFDPVTTIERDEATAQPIIPNGDALMSFATQNPEALEQFGKNISYLVLKASQDKNPDVFADWFLEETDEKYLPIVSMFFEMPELLNMLCQHMPGVAEHRAWFDEWINAVRVLIDDGKADMDLADAAQGAETDANSTQIDGDTGRDSGSSGDTE